MQFDRQKIILFLLKAVSYVVNAVIIAVVLGLVYYWISLLIQSAQS